MREVEELGLRPEPMRKLLRDNAIKVFRLDDTGAAAIVAQEVTEAP